VNLVEIIHQLTTADGRATRELPRGLHLVYYPPADDDHPARLIAARHLSNPSATELHTVRNALLHALDTHPSDVLDDAGEWQETGRGDWQGYQLTWRMFSSAAAFSHDPDLRHRVRLAIERRETRVTNRRARQQSKRTRPAAGRGPKPML
jgi:hypothetical protein